jgi:antitoxin HicB
MNKIPAYSIQVVRLSEEDGGGFLAWVPDLPGCMSDGETRVDALQNAQQAIREWIEEAEREGAPVPVPSRVAASV